jgi:predicted alpha/beta-hydrolase family hydrolase
MAEFLFNGPKTAAITLVLAHGAGDPMDSPFMETIAEGVARAGIRVARFEFTYMRRRRETGKGGAPDPGPALMQSWRDRTAQIYVSLLLPENSLIRKKTSLFSD